MCICTSEDFIIFLFSCFFCLSNHLFCPRIWLWCISLAPIKPLPFSGSSAVRRMRTAYLVLADTYEDGKPMATGADGRHEHWQAWSWPRATRASYSLRATAAQSMWGKQWHAAQLRGWRNTVEIILCGISNSMKPYPPVFHAYTSKLEPVIVFCLSHNNSMRLPTVFRQPLHQVADSSE